MLDKLSGLVPKNIKEAYRDLERLPEGLLKGINWDTVIPSNGSFAQKKKALKRELEKYYVAADTSRKQGQFDNQVLALRTNSDLQSRFGMNEDDLRKFLSTVAGELNVDDPYDSTKDLRPDMLATALWENIIDDPNLDKKVEQFQTELTVTYKAKANTPDKQANFKAQVRGLATNTKLQTAFGKSEAELKPILEDAINKLPK